MTEDEPQPDASEPVPDGDCAEVAEAAEELAAEMDRAITVTNRDALVLSRAPELLAELRVLIGQESKCAPARLAAREALIEVCGRVSRIFRRDLAADKG